MLVLGGSVGLSGCTTDNHRQSSDELREKTAETTAEVKRDAKSMAEGVKEGWSRDKERVDLNRATREELVGAGLDSNPERPCDRAPAIREHTRVADKARSFGG